MHYLFCRINLNSAGRHDGYKITPKNCLYEHKFKSSIIAVFSRVSRVMQSIYIKEVKQIANQNYMESLYSL